MTPDPHDNRPARVGGAAYRARRPDHFLCTTIMRRTVEDEPFEGDVIVYFAVESYRPGIPARLYGEPGECHPAEAAEAEFRFLRAEFDGPPPPDDAPWALTAAEIEGLSEWFYAHEGAAMEAYQINLLEAVR